MIEQCTPGDYPELIEVWERSVRETHHFLTEDYIQYLRPLILQNYFDAVRLFCIRNASGKISAFLGLSDDKVEMLFVDPVARGKGIGKLLMQYAIEEHKISKVDVNEQNEQAVGFYRKLGFHVVHRQAVDSLGKPYPILEMELKPVG